MRYRCLLIGEDNLLIHCAKLLLDANHTIACIVTKNSFIQSWSQKNNIPHKDTMDEISIPVDYLFSIVNGVILESKHLELASIAAINYHDSPLPKYAGVHATSWAIIHGEKSHGISWHIINEGIDTGEIVYQSTFPIQENDTALTLNLRCFQEAVTGFSKILEMIETGNLVKQKQATEGRSYFGRYQPLPALGFIDWSTQNAETIFQMFRAQCFGNYDNNLGTLKLLLEDGYRIVTDMEMVNKVSSVKEGTIIDISSDGILIQTLTNQILIKKLQTVKCRDVSLKDLKLHPGLCLPELLISSMESYSTALKNEKYWIPQLTEYFEHNSYSERLMDKNGIWSTTELNCTDEKDQFVYCLAALLFYLYRINDYESSTIYLAHSKIKQALHGLFSDCIPVNLQFAHDLTCQDFVQLVKNHMNDWLKRGSYLSDIHYRHPTLSSLHRDPLIVIGNIPDYFPENALLYIEVNEDSGLIRMHHRMDKSYQGGILHSLIDNLPEHYFNILHGLRDEPETLVYQLSFLTEMEKRQLMDWGVGEYVALP